MTNWVGTIKRNNGFDPIDYNACFKSIVKDLSISPSEAWKMDLYELILLSDDKEQASTDISMMINFERKANGARDKRHLIT